MGAKADQKNWVEARATQWADALGEMAKVAEERCRQTAHAGIQKSIQQEWQFLQRVTDGLGEEFDDVGRTFRHNETKDEAVNMAGNKALPHTLCRARRIPNQTQSHQGE
jgi:predicted transcriptional regulator